ncbi:MAG: bifunctional ornithine acetyltransferase/N-acetylglutamate synthase, partial [Pseudomonadota bacterium]
MADTDHSAEIARKSAAIVDLTREIEEHRRALGEQPGVSPFAPASFPDLPPVPGVRFAAVSAGVRYTTGRLDVMLAELAEGSVMAGTFTRSGTRAAPVLWCEDRIAEISDKPGGERLAVLVNAGNANAFTGSNGMQAVEAAVTGAGDALGISAKSVFMASTGVIGEPLPADRITAKLSELVDGLDGNRIEDAAEAIRTTDTFAKGASAQTSLDGETVTISGIAKGSGMIAPDMATMLVFVFTDAVISQSLLQSAVSSLTDQTFNAITVDSDTSTSDTLLVGATCQSSMPPLTLPDDARYPAFHDALRDVMQDL